MERFHACAVQSRLTLLPLFPTFLCFALGHSGCNHRFQHIPYHTYLTKCSACADVSFRQTAQLRQDLLALQFAGDIGAFGTPFGIGLGFCDLHPPASGPQKIGIAATSSFPAAVRSPRTSKLLPDRSPLCSLHPRYCSKLVKYPRGAKRRNWLIDRTLPHAYENRLEFFTIAPHRRFWGKTT